MTLQLLKSTINQKSEIIISGSKSETNRLLLLQALYPEISIQNISNSDDSDVMSMAIKSQDTIIDVHHAGTAMRFLTAFFASKVGAEVTLTGSDRMQQRPIKILVDALRELGADIAYTKNEGFPPVKIKGQKLINNKISLPANVSSQYISALLLIAPSLPNGLDLALMGQITSVPYIKMTLDLLSQVGIENSFIQNQIIVKNKNTVQKQTISVESDWSSASYFYSIVALSDVDTQIILSNYKPKSLQGDSRLAKIYTHFGVQTFFDGRQITILKNKNHKQNHLKLDLNNCPDIAQTIAVTCFALAIPCQLIGLHTLKIKETDRLEALKTELSKLGAKISVTNHSLKLETCATINKNVTIATYQDHRMAMAFAPLALRTDINIENADVVSKSYPNYWTDLSKIGIQINQQ
ncbi:MAG: hypothetical protein RLZZ312_1826 [Bacteroidota bacterium]